MSPTFDDFGQCTYVASGPSTAGASLEAMLELVRNFPKYTGPYGLIIYRFEWPAIREALDAGLPAGPTIDPFCSMPVYSASALEEAARIIWHYGLGGRYLKPIGSLAAEFAVMAAIAGEPIPFPDHITR